MTDITSLISTAVTMVKGLSKISKKTENAALENQIADLAMQLAAVKNEGARLTTENQNLKAKLEERNNNPVKYTGLIYKDNKGEVYCPACYDKHGERIHLSVREEGRSAPLYRCPVCKVSFF